MSFSAFETSQDAGEPVELYLFRYGSPASAYFAYTDAEYPVTFEGITYQPTPIDRGAVTSAGTLDKAALRVTTAQDIGVADLFRLYPPSEVVLLTIRQGHLNDPSSQFLVFWAGIVTGFSVNPETEEAEYDCRPITTVLKRNGLRRNYQYGCPLALYSTGPGKCNANKAAATVTKVTLAVNTATISLDPDWVDDTEKTKYEGGLAEWTVADGRTEYRTILRAYADGRVVLTGYAVGLLPGGSVALSRGCNRLMDGCNSHNNIRNFGGQPWIPLKSPIGIKNNFY